VNIRFRWVTNAKHNHGGTRHLRYQLSIDGVTTVVTRMRTVASFLILVLVFRSFDPPQGRWVLIMVSQSKAQRKWVLIMVSQSKAQREWFIFTLMSKVGCAWVKAPINYLVHIETHSFPSEGKSAAGAVDPDSGQSIEDVGGGVVHTHHYEHEACCVRVKLKWEKSMVFKGQP
jgi:hypothetical protein